MVSIEYISTLLRLFMIHNSFVLVLCLAIALVLPWVSVVYFLTVIKEFALKGRCLAKHRAMVTMCDLSGRTEGAMSAKLAALYDEYYGKIAVYAYSRIGDKNEAEDLAGDVFLKALQSLKSYKERGVPMQAWLFRIAHNLVVDRLRQRSKLRTVPIDEVNESRLHGGPDPQILAENNIQIERVKKAMEQLTREQQEVLGLRFFGEFSSKETASILNKSDGAVREMQRAALEKLRKILIVDNEDKDGR